MKSIFLYQCEICGTQYKFSEDAEKCEKFHVQPKGLGFSISSCKYQPYHVQGANQYPIKVTVVMADGKPIEYKG